MLLALLQTFLASVNKILTKKSLTVCDTHVLVFQLTAAIAFPLVILLFIITNEFNTSLYRDLFFLMLISASLVIFFVKNPLLQKVYKEEKVQSIMPFENINQFMIIVVSFFMFAKDSSVVTLVVTMISLWLIFFSRFNLKFFSLPKNMSLIFSWQFMQMIHTLLLWYILSIYAFSSYYFYYVFFMIICVLIFLTITKKFHLFKWLWKEYYKYRIYSSLVWTSSFLLYLYFIHEFWLVVSILFWLFWMISTVVLSVIYLKEKLSYKDLFLSITIAILTFIWFYFK